MSIMCSSIYYITLNLKESAKVSSSPGKTMAQDNKIQEKAAQMGKSSAIEMDIEFPSPFHRTSWVSQHREKSWEVVGHRGWLVPAVPDRGGAWVAPLGQEAPGPPKRELCDGISYAGGAQTSHVPLGRKERQQDKARFTVWQQWEKGEQETNPQNTPWSRRPWRPK